MYEHESIESFNPGVERLVQEHQAFLDAFNAGEGFESFNVFISKEALGYAKDGEGVTYLVFDYFKVEGEEECKKLVAYYTIAATSIPYIDRIKLEPEEAEKLGKEYDETKCGIPALELKMFAVDINYQDKFYCFEGEKIPIAAIILKKIVDFSINLMTDVIAIKAIFLHAVPTAENFYLQNQFYNAEEYMEPLYSVDDEFQAMYMPLKNIMINRDK